MARCHIADDSCLLFWRLLRAPVNRCLSGAPLFAPDTRHHGKQQPTPLRSGNGKISRLARSMRVDQAFRLVGIQSRANDTELCARDMMAYNKLASDAMADVVEIRVRNIDQGQVRWSSPLAIRASTTLVSTAPRRKPG